jgi:hypothetical protein
MKLIFIIIIILLVETLKGEYREKQRNKLGEKIEDSYILRTGTFFKKESKWNDFLDKVKIRFDKFRFFTVYRKIFKFESEDNKIYNLILTRYLPLLVEIMLKVFIVTSWFYFSFIILYISFSFIVVYYEEVFLFRKVLKAVHKRHIKSMYIIIKLKDHLSKVNTILYDITFKIKLKPDDAIYDLCFIQKLKIHYILKSLEYLEGMDLKNDQLQKCLRRLDDCDRLRL